MRRGVTLLLACLVSGCFVADVTLEADGSGTIELWYRFPPLHATVATETARFSSPSVTVHSLEPSGDLILLKGSFSDATALSSAEGFRQLSVRLDQRGLRRRLRIAVRNPTADPRVADVLPPPTIALALPGPAREVSRWGTIDGNRVTWIIPFETFAHSRRTKLSVSYEVAPVR